MGKEEAKGSGLELHSTEELASELEKRFDATVICLYKNIGKDVEDKRIYYTGGSVMILGLIHCCTIVVEMEEFGNE